MLDLEFPSVTDLQLGSPPQVTFSLWLQIHDCPVSSPAFPTYSGPGCLSIMPTITAEGPLLPGSWRIWPQCEWNAIFFLQERWLYKPLILLTILKALILRISVTSWVLRTLFFCALQLSLPPSTLCGDEKSLGKCYFHPSPLVSKVLSQTDLLSLLQLFLAIPKYAVFTPFQSSCSPCAQISYALLTCAYTSHHGHNLFITSLPIHQAPDQVSLDTFSNTSSNYCTHSLKLNY